MSPTRRTFLRTTGSALGAALGLFGSVRASGRASATHDEHAWRTVTTPTERDLADVVQVSNRAYAVGGGGVVLERHDGVWRTVLESGPDDNGANLTGVDVTESGRTVWFVGASGTVGSYDTETGSVTAHTIPGVTSNFTDVAVTGDSDGANVYVTDASGHVHVSFANGTDESWSHQTPGSGATIRALDFYGARQGVLVDGNQAVFATTDGQSWERIGIEDANHGLTAVDADSQQTVRVAGSGGAVYERGSDGWNVVTPIGKTLQDVAVAPCGCVFAVAGGGTILHYRPGRSGNHDGGSQRRGTHDIASSGSARRKHPGGWHVPPTPTGENLHAISLRHPHVAVGAAGTVLERE